LSNLNGTDFVPYFLEWAKKKFGPQKLCILLYWTKQEYLDIVEEKLKFKWYNVIYKQDGYSDFNWADAQKAMDEYQDTINILLVARSTPKIPLQELWTSRNYQKIQQNKLLVVNTWGLFDFIAWAQKRAPKFRRTIKLEWLYRFITDPKRNARKVKNSLAIFPYIVKYLVLGKK
jgi:exopolysaccharide biosynthesis WecB/TagA/CpsF family protein